MFFWGAKNLEALKVQNIYLPHILPVYLSAS